MFVSAAQTARVIALQKPSGFFKLIEEFLIISSFLPSAGLLFP